MSIDSELFRLWLTRKSWAQAVRYCRVVALLMLPATLAINVPLLHDDSLYGTPQGLWLLAWQLGVEGTCIAMLLANRFSPAARSSEGVLNLFCGLFMLFTTWAGVRGVLIVSSGLVVFAMGSTFIAAVICTPRPVRRPMYALSLLALGTAAWSRIGAVEGVLAMLVLPFCVVVLCLELDKLTFTRNLELFEETQRAEAECARADKVLYNVLPASIADELKRDDRVNAVKFENMGVLFADIAGFTTFSRALPPDALVMVLNQIFSAFDELVERHGLEKIKTIGDAYMVVSHQRLGSMAVLALGMVEAMEQYNRANGTRLAMRIGMHAGPAVAGVIGVKRFLYDVWGDTVNLASRMEATSEPGAIHVTEAVWRQTRGQFRYEAREPVEIKGRGTMETWWLRGPLPGGLPAIDASEGAAWMAPQDNSGKPLSLLGA